MKNKKPPRGWEDLDERYWVKNLKGGPMYKCKECGQENDCRTPIFYHTPGCKNGSDLGSENGDE